MERPISTDRCFHNRRGNGILSLRPAQDQTTTLIKALVPKGNGHRLPGLYLFICYKDCEQDLAKNAFWGSLVALEPLNIPTPEPLTTIGFI